MLSRAAFLIACIIVEFFFRRLQAGVAQISGANEADTRSFSRKWNGSNVASTKVAVMYQRNMNNNRIDMIRQKRLISTLQRYMFIRILTQIAIDYFFINKI